MRIALLGDIAFFGIFSLKNNNTLYDYFKDIAELLSSYDLVIGNLETPFVTNAKSYGHKSAYIKSECENSALLKYLNVDIVNLANNHIYDFGEAGYRSTIDNLNEEGIKYFGVDTKEIIIEIDNNKIILNGYCCYSTNPLGIKSGEKGAINALDYATVAEKLERNKNEECLNILSMHCGQEHVNYPNYDHVRMARQLADISPYVFYGHHPHVAQGTEIIKDSVLAYSLGNFCFDDVYTSKSDQPLIKQTQNNKESYVLDLTIENNKIVQHEMIPIFMREDKMLIGAPEISEKLKRYNEYLKLEEDIFVENRKAIIQSYIASRKKARNLKWYLKRLNLNSFFQIKNARDNAKKYHDSITKYLN